ncbi:YciI family protein [Actinoplanes sp. CA-252034]|uniref:YciI family protein n=1 Tax=Actinoplanes sp. CA-252034 TaxID=3239906 RepID=UPI003D96250F
MWIVELTFTPAPERLAARPAHRDRLTALHAAGAVRAAGPLADDSGALIILDVPGRAGADEILAADPYFRTPGVEVRSVREWSPFLR